MTAATDGIVRPLTPEELNAVGRALLTSEALIKLGVLIGCAVLAYVLTGLILRALGGQNRSTSVLFGEKLFDGALFPWLLFGLAVVSRNLVLPDTAPVLARPGLPLLLSLAVIRLAVRVLRAAFPRSPGVRLVERRLSWAAWIGVVLWLTGVLPIVLAELDEIGWKLGSARITLRALVEGLFNAVIVLMFVVWISAVIENKLIGSRTDNLSMRKMASNASRSLLFFLGLLMALSAAGIDLTAVSVFGGAIGVGLGLGLQKLASNYVSGFVILAERSLHIGDVVKVDNFEGRIIDINTRSTIIRADNGRLAIVPNEMLVTARVENASKADPSLQASTSFLVPHGADFAALSPRLLEAVKAVGRVLDQPGKRSAVYLSNFLTDGMELTVSYWIGDPANGQANVRSDVNEAILRVLRENGYKLPQPGGATVPPSGAAAQPSGAAAQPSGVTAQPSGVTEPLA